MYHSSSRLSGQIADQVPSEKPKSGSWLHAAWLFVGQVAAESRDQKSVSEEPLKSHTVPLACGLLRVSVGA
jgi:hypothetical protein